jgi:hypothetical protein
MDRLLRVVLITGLLSSRAGAQARDTIPLNVWGSLALGSANGPGATRVGTALTLWGTHGFRAAAIRGASSSRFLEAGDVEDYSLMVGARLPRRHVTAVAGAGIGVSTGRTGYLQPRLPNAAILAYGGELAASFRYVGLGISVFGAVGETRRSYSAIGLVVEGGKIH